ncbi:retrovirus-related Pol polyprotein from transposon TNT 1-94 [Nephila pilipes]|uniref:Retrovirus-related Pol polyprotein from transposon TNT 1-94 n=1 Tax=Nephila pilipes TaxID=299642 RepID=A0A8X6T2E3_NEPPI|nr:retrovirus-related Pol polyprotein from transposon TNT 1-94 [Nephila pilipes]
MTANHKGDLYYVKPKIETATIVTKFQKWHQKFGHLSESDLRKLKTERMVRGLHFDIKDSVKDCKIFIQSKQTVAPFSKESKFKNKIPLELVHSSVCGPMRVPSQADSYYFFTFIDDKSRYVVINVLKTKDEAKKAFINYKTLVENQTGKEIKTLRTDNGL